MRGALLCVIACIVVLPAHAHAAIVITEIAWMGSASSANDEWIELHNTGSSAVTVDGWRLTDGNSINITLNGTIEAGAYAVLERTDDTSAPGPMFMHYTGALSNAGATLSLFRSDTTLEDRVAGGENWASIGGDNAAKQTPQYNLTRWITAVPTPGFAAPASGTPPEDENDQGEDDTSHEVYREDDDEDEPNVTIELQLPDTKLVLEIDGPSVAYVNQDLSFKADASGLGKTHLDSLAYTWNFGDLTVQKGKHVQHTYSYPGEYAVTLHALFSRHEQVIRKTVKVLPVAFSLSRARTGELLVHNNAKYEVDVSGYTIRAGKDIVFPPRTILLPQSTIRIPVVRSGFPSTLVTMSDQAGTQVAVLGMPSASQSAVEPVFAETASTPALLHMAANTTETYQYTEVLESKKGNFSFANDVSISPEESVVALVEPSKTQLAAVSAGEGSDPAKATKTQLLPFLGLGGVVALGIFAVFFTRKTNQI